MGEEKPKTKSLKRSRGCQDEIEEKPTPKRTALTPVANSAKRASAQFRAPAFTRPTPAQASGSHSSPGSTPVDDVETPVKSTHKKSVSDKDKKTVHEKDNPVPEKAKSAAEKGKGKETVSTPVKSTENAPTPNKPHKSSINKPFVPLKIKNPAAAAALRSTPTLARLASFGPPPELTLTEKRDLLKRAIRITKEDDVTRELITKWRTVGREVAEDLCKLIKDSGMLDSIQEPQEKDRDSGFGGGSWGFGPRIQSRFEQSWGWMDPQTKPESGWGWGSVNEHMAEGEGREGEYPDNSEEREVELPSAERLKKELEAALKQPYKKRESLLPLGGLDAYHDTMANAESAEAIAIREQLKAAEALEREEKKKPWGIGRMLEEFGIPPKLFNWDDEEEEWKDPA
ncbi:hypothetical protein CALCODRAFT_552398 [Calocera cornea HHB12733]|uniref:Uncharacterized protein n=1 Tax=Calocera cornea HHB12733 TaxID=1353952 RepID=A0A165KC51_9BASI|nr:hypothetical protein CALCODRAFT_552398 [Calocera cornea HHB12733]